MKIIMPDGAVFNERDETMLLLTHSPDFKGEPKADLISGPMTTDEAERRMLAAQINIAKVMGPVARTIAVVAAELEAAIAASARVKSLTDELHALLGRKARKSRKVAP